LLGVDRRALWLTLATLALGLVVALQWRTPAAPSLLSESYYRGVSAGAVDRLESEQRQLKAEIAALQAQLSTEQEAASSRKETLAGLGRELERQRALAGLTPLHGPGVYILLQDSPRAPLPGDDPTRYQVRDFQIRDLVNTLWQGGAEAVAINEERMVATSAVYGNGGALLVNGSRLTSPFELRAIGNPDRLDRYLTDPNVLKAFKAAAATYGIVFRVSRERDLPLPVFGGAFPQRYAAARSNP
jgi:uncharacterized protein YlxW (UPF0749 family)